MSWNFSAALAAEYLDTCCADTELSARLNSIRTVEQFSCGDRTPETFRRFPYGMTCEHLTDDDGEALLTWYLEGFPALGFHQPENEQVLTTRNPSSGFRCCESFGRLDRATSLWKIPPNLFGTDSTLSSKAWTQAGTMRNATKVIKDAVPEVVAAVESGKLAVSTAALLAEKPPEQQRETLEKCEKEDGGRLGKDGKLRPAKYKPRKKTVAKTEAPEEGHVIVKFQYPLDPQLSDVIDVFLDAFPKKEDQRILYDALRCIFD